MFKIDYNRLLSQFSLNTARVGNDKCLELILSDLAFKSNLKENYISRLCFLDYFDIPLLLAERLFKVLAGDVDSISKSALGKVILAKLTQQNMLKLTFEIYDFDGNGKIDWNDIKLIWLSIYHYSEQIKSGTNMTLKLDHEFSKLITSKDPNFFSDYFEKFNGISLTVFKEFIVKRASDPFILVYYYLLKLNFIYFEENENFKYDSPKQNLPSLIAEPTLVIITAQKLKIYAVESTGKQAKPKPLTKIDMTSLVFNSALGPKAKSNSPPKKENIGSKLICTFFKPKENGINSDDIDNDYSGRPSIPFSSRVAQVKTKAINESRNPKTSQPTQKIVLNLSKRNIEEQTSLTPEVTITRENNSSSPHHRNIANVIYNDATKNLTKFNYNYAKKSENTELTLNTQFKKYLCNSNSKVNKSSNTPSYQHFNSITVSRMKKKLPINSSTSQHRVAEVSYKEVIENALSTNRYLSINKKNMKNLANIEKLRSSMIQEQSTSNNEVINSEPIKPEKISESVNHGVISLLCEETSEIISYFTELFEGYLLLTADQSKVVISLVNSFIKEEGEIKLNNKQHLCFSIQHNYYKHYYMYDESSKPFVQASKSMILRKGPNSIVDYSVESFLGQGKFSTVHKAFKIGQTNTKQYVALKVIKKPQMDKMDLISSRKEISILKELRHPNIVRLYTTIENYKCIYLVLEYFESVNLYEFLKQRNFDIPEAMAKSIIKKLIIIIDHLQEKFIIHRDLKPENILIKVNKPTDDKKSNPATINFDIKLIDFGLSRVLGKDQLVVNEPYGTLVSLHLIIFRPMLHLR